LLLRDLTSTFIKGRSVHPKWIRLVGKDNISKQYPTTPHIKVKHNDITLYYPEILSPVFVKGIYDGKGYDVKSIECELPSLVKHASHQMPLWGAIALSLLKEGAAGGGAGGAGSSSAGGSSLTSTSAGTNSPLHSVGRRKKRRKFETIKSIILRAPAITGDSEKGDTVDYTMKNVRRYIRDEEKSMTTSELCDGVEGLSPKMLENFGNEYGIEEKDGEWTVNEAIDDDIIENFVYPRMNGASPDGGAWSGMQADLTAPRGPTELTDEENTTFADPKNRDLEDEEQEPILNLTIQEKDVGPEEL